MGLADELKTLEELHDKGKLTDKEYADAKAAVLKGEASQPARARGAVGQQPQKAKSPGCLTKFAVIVGAFILLVIILVLKYSDTDTTRQTSSPSSYGIDASPEAQNGREEWIKKMEAMGIFLKLEDSPFAWVGPAWDGLTFEEKQKAAGVVAAHYYLKNPKNTFVILKDGYTGKTIGNYSLDLGLQLK